MACHSPRAVWRQSFWPTKTPKQATFKRGVLLGTALLIAEYLAVSASCGHPWITPSCSGFLWPEHLSACAASCARWAACNCLCVCNSWLPNAGVRVHQLTGVRGPHGLRLHDMLEWRVPCRAGHARHLLLRVYAGKHDDHLGRHHRQRIPRVPVVPRRVVRAEVRRPTEAGARGGA